MPRYYTESARMLLYTTITLSLLAIGVMIFYMLGLFFLNLKAPLLMRQNSLQPSRLTLTVAGLKNHCM